MKHYLLTAGLLGLVSCSGPREKSTTAQPEATQQLDELRNSDAYAATDTTFLVDTTLVHPVLTYPTNLCSALQQAWGRYVQTHKVVKQQFPFKDGIVACVAEVEIVIDSTGDVNHITSSDRPPATLAKHCVAALAPIFKNTKWQPLYRKGVKRRDALVTRGVLFIILNPDYSLAMYLKDWRHGYVIPLLTCGRHHIL